MDFVESAGNDDSHDQNGASMDGIRFTISIFAWVLLYLLHDRLPGEIKIRFRGNRGAEFASQAYLSMFYVQGLLVC